MNAASLGAHALRRHEPLVGGLILLLIGIAIYVKYSPKREITELKEALLSRDMILRRAYR